MILLFLFFQLPGFGCLDYLVACSIDFISLPSHELALISRSPSNLSFEVNECSQCENGCQYYKHPALQLLESYFQLYEVEFCIKIGLKRSLSKGPRRICNKLGAVNKEEVSKIYF